MHPKPIAETSSDPNFRVGSVSGFVLLFIGKSFFDDELFWAKPVNGFTKGIAIAKAEVPKKFLRLQFLFSDIAVKFY